MSTSLFVTLNGAGEGIRTLDIHLGKVVLYQLSYARKKNYYLTVREIFQGNNVVPEPVHSQGRWNLYSFCLTYYKDNLLSNAFLKINPMPPPM